MFCAGVRHWLGSSDNYPTPLSSFLYQTNVTNSVHYLTSKWPLTDLYPHSTVAICSGRLFAVVASM